MLNANLQTFSATFGMRHVTMDCRVKPGNDDGESRSLDPRRVDDEIGKAAVAIVHAGKHLIDLRQR